MMYSQSQFRPRYENEPAWQRELYTPQDDLFYSLVRILILQAEHRLGTLNPYTTLFYPQAQTSNRKIVLNMNKENSVGKTNVEQDKTTITEPLKNKDSTLESKTETKLNHLNDKYQKDDYNDEWTTVSKNNTNKRNKRWKNQFVQYESYKEKPETKSLMIPLEEKQYQVLSPKEDNETDVSSLLDSRESDSDKHYEHETEDSTILDGDEYALVETEENGKQNDIQKDLTQKQKECQPPKAPNRIEILSDDDEDNESMILPSNSDSEKKNAKQ